MNDIDTIALGAACILDCDQGPHWSVLADLLNALAVRAENGEIDALTDYAVVFARLLMADDQDHL